MTTPVESHVFGCRMSGAVPSFHCPSCDVPLHYDETGASDGIDGLGDFADYFSCPAGCGSFEYERRRHRLRLVDAGYASGVVRI